MLKNSLFILFSLVHFSFAQVSSNLFCKQDAITASDSLKTGVDFYTAYQNSAVSHYDNNNDPLHYILSPYLHYKFNPQITINVRANLENIRDNYLYTEKTYWSDEFANHRGGIEIGTVEYQNDWLQLRFGRDYFIPGKRFYEGLLFSEYNYSYDQVWLALRNKHLEIASYYLDLTDWQTAEGPAQRYLNGHRFTWKFGKGYFSFNDVIVYGGVDRQIKPALFNPFMLYYPYQKNRRYFESNSLMSFELYFPWNDFFLFAEFLIDDYQVDKEEPGDLEPNEWGMNITVGKNNIIKNLNWKLNYTRVANRTFNAPIKDYEKYINKNYPIGHFLGNNFWEVKSTLSYLPAPSLKADLIFYYAESGQEALYAAFDTTYFNYTIEQGYTENFPFGQVHKQAGMLGKIDYSGINNLRLSVQAAYWLINERLDSDFNFRLALQYRLGIYQF